MKKIITIIIVIVLSLVVFKKEIIVKADDSELVTVSMKSMNTNYSSISSPFSYNDFCTLSVLSSGGEHKTFGKNKAYSNFVEIGIELNIDSSRNILGTRERIVDDSIKKLPSSFCGKEYKLPTRIGYGVILVGKKYEASSMKFDSPIYIGRDGNGVNSLSFTDDADYHVFIIFKSTGTKTCYNVIEYVIPIRTYSYVRDIETNLDVKESGCFYGPIKIDCLGRNCEIYVNGTKYGNYKELTAPAEYHISIYGNDYLCESYTFTIFDQESDNLYVMIENIRGVLDDSNSDYIVYEAEHSFSIKWLSKSIVHAVYSYNYGELSEFENEHEFIDKGLYYINVENSFTKSSYQYLVYLVDDDNPSYNYKKLVDSQDHSMIPVWFEVYDIVSESNLCFSTYQMALQAALSLETEKVEYNGYEYIYENKKYNSAYEYMVELEKKAKENIEIKYLDLDDKKELYFQNKLIEDDLFLHPDFTFASLSDYESSEINLVGESININIDYNTPISTYNLPSGNYRIIEKDKFGNSSVYNIIYDYDNPSIEITYDDSNTGSISENINCRYFTFSNISDELDKYVIVKINNEFLLSTDYLGYYFTEPGVYNIKAYDRSGNYIKGSITIANKLAHLVNVDGSVVVEVNNGVKINKVVCNNEEIEFKIPRFSAKENDQYFSVYVQDDLGNIDLLEFGIKGTKNEINIDLLNDITETNNTYNYNKIYILLISIGLGLIPIVIGTVILIVGAKKDEHNS